MTARKVGRWLRSDASMERAKVYDQQRSVAIYKRVREEGL